MQYTALAAHEPPTHPTPAPQICPTAMDKIRVLKDMIFPLCEKLGQTIIFVRTRETVRGLHTVVSGLCARVKRGRGVLPQE